jgi:Rieske Fe-S protein
VSGRNDMPGDAARETYGEISRVVEPRDLASTSHGKDAPHWKTDFSVNWDRTSYITRREFTRFLAIGSVAMAAGNTFMAIRSAFPARHDFPEVEIPGGGDLQAGQNLTFAYPVEGGRAILLRHEDGTYSAFSQRCPHLGCSVFYSEHSRELECPCHEGFFDPRTGEVLAGPPQRGLEKITLREEGGTLMAVGVGEHE